jgi:GT2 family glycosyltransferase
VDADHEIDRGWVAAAVQALRVDGVVGVGCLCHAPLDGTWVQQAYGALRAFRRGCTTSNGSEAATSPCVVPAFDAAGGFDTSLTTCEDVDLCNRLRAGGGRIVSDARMKNVHLGDPASLSALFKGERWRGRDNLRVSLRSSLTWRGLPSIVIPIVDVTDAGRVRARVIAGAPAGLAAASPPPRRPSSSLREPPSAWRGW